MALREHIEHTLLKPDAQVRDVEALCAEAKAYGLLGVCVNPCYVEMASRLLAGTDVKVVTVVGFPLGQNESSVKAREARRAVETGPTKWTWSLISVPSRTATTAMWPKTSAKSSWRRLRRT